MSGGDKGPDYLCFTAEEANSTISMSVVGSAPSVTLETSSDKVTWTPFTVRSTTITLSNIGDKVYFRGDNNGFATNDSNYNKFVMTGKISASGNIMSLVDSTVESLTIPSEYCYGSMFRECTSLTTAPALPATTLVDYCYANMFRGCTSLTTAPALPATTLAENCYRYMFNGCTSLTTAPTLPATTITSYCYYGMFRECTSLKTAPSLPAATLAIYCYDSMFYNCTSLTTAPELPATELANYCYGFMFYRCTSLTTAPALPATTLANDCYMSMFYGCRSLKTAPVLPATTLASDCYYYMFYGCTKLNYIEVAFSAWDPSTAATSDWVTNVSSTGTFKCPAVLPQTRGTSNIPSGWTIETK